jgi:RNA polymerase sigma factor (sigma-70 family)
MGAENTFLELIARVRAGEEAAAAELVRRYEPAIRRAVRLQMRDPRLRRGLDSGDVCQSVLASFFCRAALGQFDLVEPGQLSRLLLTMARNKLASQARKPHVLRRDHQAAGWPPPEARGLLAPGPSPSQQVAWQDLLGEVRKLLSEEERLLADRRSQSLGWAEIAAELGGSPESLRKKLARALDRVARRLGLEEWHQG